MKYFDCSNNLLNTLKNYRQVKYCLEILRDIYWIMLWDIHRKWTNIKFRL